MEYQSRMSKSLVKKAMSNKRGSQTAFKYTFIGIHDSLGFPICVQWAMTSLCIQDKLKASTQFIYCSPGSGTKVFLFSRN